jgi:hypothetical protein
MGLGDAQGKVMNGLAVGLVACDVSLTLQGRDIGAFCIVSEYLDDGGISSFLGMPFFDMKGMSAVK